MNEPNAFRRSVILALAWWLVGLSIDTSADTPKRDGDPVEVRLRGTATVPATRVTVGDVAEITGGTPALRELIGKFDLEEFGTGTSVTVKRRQVEFRLRLADLPADAFRVTGANESVATAVRQPISADSVVKAATAAALKRMPWPEEELSVKLVQPVTAPLPNVADPADVIIKADPHSSNVSPGRVQMDVSIFVRGEKKISLPVYLDIRVMQRMAIARSGLPKGELLTENNVLIDRRPVETSNPGALPESIIGRKLKRPLPAGQVVQASDLDEASVTTAVLVKAKSPVKIIARVGALTIEAAGEAMQDGRLEDRVKVKNTESKKVLSARVTGPGKVEIDP